MSALRGRCHFFDPMSFLAINVIDYVALVAALIAEIANFVTEITVPSKFLRTFEAVLMVLGVL